MVGRTSCVILLIVFAYVGGAVVLHMCWQHSVLLAIVAAPFGGSLAVLSAALLLYRRTPDAGRGEAERRAPDAGWDATRKLPNSA